MENDTNTINWKPIKTAPRTAELILLWIGETIPDLPDIRGGQWIAKDEAANLGYDLTSDGGWMIWNAANDWFVLDFKDPIGWAPTPIIPKLNIASALVG